MTRATWLAVVAVTLATAFAPAATAEQPAPTGARINLLAGNFQVFPANEPFTIWHGWGLAPGGPEMTPQALGRYGFSLAVDGVERRENFVWKLHLDDPEFGQLQHRRWVHNFPAGMTGTHTFTGLWFGPCAGLVAGGFAPGPCEHPNDRTTATAPLTITVVFV